MDNNYSVITISKNLLITFLLLIITLSLFSSSSFGNQKTNFYKDENIEISFLKAWDSKEATLYALFIKMKKNWKTYWKYPGDSGFSPEFKIIESNNLKKIEISWPTPKVFFENGSVINGYKKELILPIFFYKEKSSKKIDFKLNFLMGFCDDICIPIKFIINSKNALKTNELKNKLVSNSLEKMPQDLSNSKNLIECEVKKINKKMKLLSKFDSNFFSNNHSIDQLILEYLDGQIWFSEISKTNERFEFLSTINSFEDNNFFLDKSKIEYTIITRSGGFQQKGCKSPIN
ncbi:MAG: hypothetical protein CML70_12235 [Rhodobacterales bacterium]|jgi:DsbC/DsbD-like thiol-disulfide interchange protein|nr:MAG: hypothetical protein CML70_12235 [Rhodobacterales bacterium]